MARDGQIQPVAKPVQAFIEPARLNAAEPARPAQLPGMGQPNVVQQGGMPNVQGENPYERLASSLATFNQQLTPALQKAGVMFADQQMQQGEARARAAALQGLAQNDASMEQSELDRARANRALAKRDPQAAGIMALLNPYAQIGFERGLAKLAGAEAVTGLPAYIKERGGQIDYLAPDQGQGTVRRLTNEYTDQLMKRYGLSADNPATQRFVVPEVEKQREKLGLELMKDRQQYITDQRIGSTAGLLWGFYTGTMKEGQVEYNGRTYFNGSTPEQANSFRGALRGRMQQLLDNATKQGMLPGDGRGIQEKIYKLLGEQGRLTENEDFRLFIDSLDSTDKLVDDKGREILDPATGRPMYQRLGSLYKGLGRDAELADIRFRAAKAGERRDLKELMMTSQWVDKDGNKVEGFENYIYAAISKFPPGPERERAAEVAVAQYWNKYQQQLRANGISFPELQKKRMEIGTIRSELMFAANDDPDMPARELARLNQRRGSNWNATNEYKRGEQLAGQIMNPKERDKFRRDWSSRVSQLDKENTSLAGYKDARDAVISSRVNAELNNYYPPSNVINQNDRAVSRARQYEAYVPYVNTAIRNAEAQKGSRLTDAEVRTITTQALNQYGKGADGKPQKDYLFPGSPMTKTPSVSPYQKPTNNNGEPPKPDTSKPKPVPPVTYNVDELDAIPDRKLVLRNYENRAVLSHGAIRELIDAVGLDKPWPKSFERAWRDSGARTPGEFLDSQLKRYPGEFQLPPELRSKVMKRASVQAGLGDNLISIQATQQRFPSLASIAGGAVDLLMGVTPAMASVRMEYDPAGGAPSHPTLTKLSTGRLVQAPVGRCVTGVLNTLAANGIPNPDGSGKDVGNNPRGMAAQMVRDFGWRSLPGLGQRQIIRSQGYGAFDANVIPEAEYLQAVKAGRIPSGALIFSTRHGSWQAESHNSKGFDVAIARNGGRNLWNGYLSGVDVYSGSSKWRMVLIPSGSNANTQLSRN